MKLIHLLTLALTFPVLAADPTPGQVAIQKRKSSGAGFELLAVTPENSKVLGFDSSGNLTMTDAGSATWGGITGTLASQSDLSTALAGKVPTTLAINGHALTGNIDITAADVGLVVGSNVQSYSSNLTTLGTGFSIQSGPVRWNFGGNGTFSVGTLANSDLQNSSVTIAGNGVALGGSVNAATLVQSVLNSISTTRGTILYRGLTGWVALAPANSGDALISGGTGADPSFAAREVPLTFSTGLTRSTNTITVNADAGLPTQTGNSGKFLTTNGTTSSWASVATGITIGSTAITSGTAGRLLTSGTTVGELTLGTGISAWLGTPAEANLKAAQSGLAWLDTAQTFSAVQTFAAGTAGAPSITLGDSTTGFYRSAANELAAAVSGTQRLKLTANDLTFASAGSGNGGFILGGSGGQSVTMSAQFGGSVSIQGAYQSRVDGPLTTHIAAYNGNATTTYWFLKDIGSANVLALSNGTNANSFQVHNTTTSSTSFEAFAIDWQTTANVATVGPIKGGTGGTVRPMAFSTAARLANYTVANLPSASTWGAGAMAFVTDANATTVGSTVAGGGSNKVFVISDGTNWIIH